MKKNVGGSSLNNQMGQMARNTNINFFFDGDLPTLQDQDKLAELK